MRCPYCYEQLSLLGIIKTWFRLNVLPNWVFNWLCEREERRYEKRLDVEFEELTGFWHQISNKPDLIDVLTKRERDVCNARVLEGASIEDVAKAMTVTRERVRAIQDKALRKLRVAKAKEMLVSEAERLKLGYETEEGE
jgi:DNA-binding CsgD family transcriptional regulator